MPHFNPMLSHKAETDCGCSHTMAFPHSPWVIWTNLLKATFHWTICYSLTVLQQMSAIIIILEQVLLTDKRPVIMAPRLKEVITDAVPGDVIGFVLL